MAITIGSDNSLGINTGAGSGKYQGPYNVNLGTGRNNLGRRVRYQPANRRRMTFQVFALDYLSLAYAKGKITLADMQLCTGAMIKPLRHNTTTGASVNVVDVAQAAYAANWGYAGTNGNYNWYLFVTTGGAYTTELAVNVNTYAGSGTNSDVIHCIKAALSGTGSYIAP